MAWINLENLGLFNRKIRDWIKTVNIHSNKIIQDSNNKFVTNDQINNWTNNKLDINANAVSASKLFKPVKIAGVEFDGSKDIELKQLIVNIQKELKHHVKLTAGTSVITIPDDMATTSGVLNLYIDGLRMIEEINYCIDLSAKTITLLESFSKDVNVELSFLKTASQPQFTIEDGHLYVDVK